MFNRKISIYTFTGGFVLSFLIGIISGNPFGVVIFRSLFSGIIIGGVGMGIIFVFKKYFPDLMGEEVKEEINSKEMGKNIDIVLPEENPHIGQENDTIEEVEEAEEVEEVAEEIETGQDEGTEKSAGETSWENTGKAADKLTSEEDSDKSGTMLPELDSLAMDSFDTGSASVSFTGRSNRSNSEAAGMESDPETLAKAVRSFMKKDEEG